MTKLENSMNLLHRFLLGEIGTRLLQEHSARVDAMERAEESLCALNVSYSSTLRLLYERGDDLYRAWMEVALSPSGFTATEFMEFVGMLESGEYAELAELDEALDAG